MSTVLLLIAVIAVNTVWASRHTAHPYRRASPTSTQFNYPYLTAFYDDDVSEDAESRMYENADQTGSKYTAEHNEVVTNLEGAMLRQGLEGAMLRQGLEAKLLPNPANTYLAPGEQVHEVEWQDGTVEALDNAGEVIHHSRQSLLNTAHKLQDDHKSFLTAELGLHPEITASDVQTQAAKVTAQAILKMMNKDCIIGDACAETTQCCTDHRCVTFADGRPGACLPRCKPVPEGSSCSSCPCASGLECMEVISDSMPNKKLCVRQQTISLPCSDNSQCNLGECCLIGSHMEDSLARCQANSAAFQSCPRGYPHPFMNVFIGACPCNHHIGLLCVEGICDWKV